MGQQRRIRRAAEQGGQSPAVQIAQAVNRITRGDYVDLSEMHRRIAFIQQMKPRNRNKPRNIRKLTGYQMTIRG